MLMNARAVAVLAVATLLYACAGDGEGLDENGRPVGEADGPLVAELASIQRHVFTPLCTGCHAGGAAPLGLRLDDGAAFAMLVGVPTWASAVASPRLCCCAWRRSAGARGPGR